MDIHLARPLRLALAQMNSTVGDLEGTRSPLLRALGVGFGPVPSDHLPPGMLLEPVSESLGRALRK